MPTATDAVNATSSTGVLNQQHGRSVEDVTALLTATVSAGSATSSTGVLDQQFWDVSVVDDMLSVFRPLIIDSNLYWQCLGPSEFVVVDGHASNLVPVPEDNVVAEQDIVLAQSTNAVSDQVNGCADDLCDDKLVSRKRKRNTKLWKKNKRKRLLNLGQEYGQQVVDRCRQNILLA